MRIGKEEGEILQNLNLFLKRESIRARIDPIVLRVEEILAQDAEAPLAWESVLLDVYGEGLPDIIHSSWVFVLRAKTNTGAERHPNSHQRVMSYRGSADLQTWEGGGWRSNHLVSDPDASIERRWLSIPPDTWHQAVVPWENWVVVSFHTVLADELIEERPDPNDIELTRQRRYLDLQK